MNLNTAPRINLNFSNKITSSANLAKHKYENCSKISVSVVIFCASRAMCAQKHNVSTEGLLKRNIHITLAHKFTDIYKGYNSLKRIYYTIHKMTGKRANNVLWGDRVVQWRWVNFQCQGVLQFGLQ